jgi:hypothetical protein
MGDEALHGTALMIAREDQFLRFDTVAFIGF